MDSLQDNLVLSSDGLYFLEDNLSFHFFLALFHSAFVSGNANAFLALS